ncbi:hypothetical protein Barb4_01792 [Bacteroidales bacterium Barb4]|nr:hypothetical protein Barb4_01792 [Bacteroidales bacterium Barb4]
MIYAVLSGLFGNLLQNKTPHSASLHVGLKVETGTEILKGRQNNCKQKTDYMIEIF